MSGDTRDPGRSSPIELTDDDVRELAGDRIRRPAAVARLKAAVPTEPIGRLVTAGPAPAAVSVKDLATLHRTGQLPATALRRRIPSEVGAEPPAEPAGRPRPGPTKRPPRGAAS